MLFVLLALLALTLVLSMVLQDLGPMPHSLARMLDRWSLWLKGGGRGGRGGDELEDMYTHDPKMRNGDFVASHGIEVLCRLVVMADPVAHDLVPVKAKVDPLVGETPALCAAHHRAPEVPCLLEVMHWKRKMERRPRRRQRIDLFQGRETRRVEDRVSAVIIAAGPDSTHLELNACDLLDFRRGREGLGARHRKSRGYCHYCCGWSHSACQMADGRAGPAAAQQGHRH